MAVVPSLPLMADSARRAAIYSCGPRFGRATFTLSPRRRLSALRRARREAAFYDGRIAKRWRRSSGPGFLEGRLSGIDLRASTPGAAACHALHAMPTDRRSDERRRR